MRPTKRIRPNCLDCGIPISHYCTRCKKHGALYRTSHGGNAHIVGKGKKNGNYKHGGYLQKKCPCGKDLSVSPSKSGLCKPCHFSSKDWRSDVSKRMKKRVKLGLHHWGDGTKTQANKLARSRSEYRIWREAVFKRDDWTCQMCGDRGCELQADHIKPFAYFPELRYEVSNGRTLCIPCHKTTDTYLNKAKKYNKTKYVRETYTDKVQRSQEGRG